MLNVPGWRGWFGGCGWVYGKKVFWRWGHVWNRWLPGPHSAPPLPPLLGWSCQGKLWRASGLSWRVTRNTRWSGAGLAWDLPDICECITKMVVCLSFNENWFEIIIQWSRHDLPYCKDIKGHKNECLEGNSNLSYCGHSTENEALQRSIREGRKRLSSLYYCGFVHLCIPPKERERGKCQKLEMRERLILRPTLKLSYSRMSVRRVMATVVARDGVYGWVKSLKSRGGVWLTPSLATLWPLARHTSWYRCAPHTPTLSSNKKNSSTTKNFWCNTVRV